MGFRVQIGRAFTFKLAIICEAFTFEFLGVFRTFVVTFRGLGTKNKSRINDRDGNGSGERARESGGSCGLVREAEADRGGEKR